MSHTYCSQKPASLRTAAASAVVLLGPRAFELVQANQVKKGDVLSVSQLAGIMAAKHTSNLIPLCHNIPISKVRACKALLQTSLLLLLLLLLYGGNN